MTDFNEKSVDVTKGNIWTGIWKLSWPMLLIMIFSFFVGFTDVYVAGFISPDVQAAVGKFATSELQVRQAREALSIAKKRYEAGAISNLDLLDAETSLSHANLQRLQVLYFYVLSRLGLDRAIGTRLWGTAE